MATKVYLSCPQCGSEVRHSRKMFQLFRNYAEGRPPECLACKAAADLDLEFSFGLGAESGRCRVVGCLLPTESERTRWKDGSTNVEFYPFLIVADDAKTGLRRYWWPYWHEVTPKKGRKGEPRVKYGQWAPNMRQSLFESLVGQARARGLAG